VRRAAVQVLPRKAASVTGIVANKLLEDPDPQVRMAAFLAMADQGRSNASAVLLQAMTVENVFRDRLLTDAATSAAAAQEYSCLRAAATLKFEKEPPAALTSVIERVASHSARSYSAGVIDLLPELVAAEPAVAAAVVIGLENGWPRDRPSEPPFELTDKADAALPKVFTRIPLEARGKLVVLAQRWNSASLSRYANEISAGFLKLLKSDKESDANRIAAAGQLIDFRKTDVDAAKTVLELITSQSGPEFGQGLLDALGRSEAPPVGKLLVDRLPTLTPALQSAALRVVLARPIWTVTLLAAVDEGKVPLTLLTLDQRQGLAAHPNKAIADEAKKLLAKGGGLPNPDRQKVIEQFLPLTKKTGDAVAGKLVFKNQCLKCHTHSGEGTKIGPDLTGMAVHPKEELLIHIMDPSRSVEGNYRQYVVATKSGQVFNGLLASETKTAIELFDTEGKKHTLLREDVDELKATTKSLMPEGFEKLVTADEFVNLLEFMTQKGKYLPLPLDKVATVITTRGMFFSETSNAERMVFRDWSPKTFEGIPFVLVDPQTDRNKNAVMLYGPNGTMAPKMPKSVSLPCQTSAKAIHLLSGISGWGFPASEKGSVSMIVRLHYADGQTEDHELRNGEHFADYIRRVDVPQSKFAFSLRGQQLRYLAVTPARKEKITEIEFVKGPDATAPIVMAVTVETGLE
jgi:putative heme-binding domain-containing protein